MNEVLRSDFPKGNKVSRQEESAAKKKRLGEPRRFQDSRADPRGLPETLPRKLDEGQNASGRRNDTSDVRGSTTISTDQNDRLSNP